MAGLVPMVKAFASPGATEDGSTVVFTIKFADGSEQRVGILAASLPAAVISLQAAGNLAEQQRSQLPPEHRRDKLSVPLGLRSYSLGTALDGTIVLEIDTRQGIPVPISMDREQATRLAAALASPDDRDRPKPS